MTILRAFLTSDECERYVRLWATIVAAGGGTLQRRSYRFEWIGSRPEVRADPTYRRALAALGYRGEVTDAFLAHYSHGQGVAPHTDAHRLRRLNVLLVAPRAGGELTIDGEVAPLGVGDGVIFEPSRQMHSVSPVDGERLVWSVGLHRSMFSRPRPAVR